MKMFRDFLIVILFLLCALSFSQQVIIDDNVTPQQLIENNLIQGCVETSNISSQINGSVNGFASFGYFEKGSSNFPFENGIMLSTGRAISGGNLVNNAILNEGQSNWLTDPDLENALGITNTLNATSIEFDFVSITNQVQFNYLLASEEYFGDFPCEYSDGFAFLIKEAGTNDPYSNIALIPGTSTPVNTNTIHPAISGFCAASNSQYFEGYNLGDTNYNGQTKVMSATATINPNVVYHIKLVIADQTDKNYDSAVFIEGNSFNALVDLGDDISTCDDIVTLDGNIGNPDATYSWFFNNNSINGATGSNYTATESGSYTVKVEIPLAGSICLIEDTIEVILSSTQTTMPISDYELCDDPSMDGFEIFDLRSRDTDVLASIPASNYTISYHYSSEDAENNLNAITNPIQNTTNNQPIFIKIVDSNDGCLTYGNFNLVVNPLPTAIPLNQLTICGDPESNGITQIDLTQYTDDIINGQANLFVTYHRTQSDANSGVNPLPTPYTNGTPNEQLFVRVLNSLTGCLNTTTLSFSVVNSPAINYEDIFIDACDQDHDGMATFDLNTITNDVLQGLSGVTITFHESLEDAETGSNPIADASNYANINIEEQVVFIRVEDDVTGCASVRSFEIHSNLLLTGTNIRNFSACDLNDDNTEEFDLIDIAEDIINDLEDVSIIFYTSESDQENGINALNPSIPFVPTEYPTVLYITLNSPTCSEISQIELILNAIVNFPNVPPANYCDDDTDGFTAIDLHSFDNSVTGGLQGYNVQYYASEADAESNSNPLPDFYINQTNPTTIYPKISSDATGCGDIIPFTINVFPAPAVMAIDDIVVCDTNQDGFTIVDLTLLYSQLVTDQTNRTFSFFGSYEALTANINAFSNISNYNTNTKDVFVKVTNTQTGCWSSESFKIYVNTLPIFPNISTYKICEFSTDGIAEFLFSSKDLQILNGQSGKKTLYFLNQTDADNRINAINKNAAYQNITNPQTIFVRVENVTDQNCYGTSSFPIEVGTNPVYNQPTDWFKCDDISNDAREVFNFTTKINEITQGINDTLEVTFHTTQMDAENAANALPVQYTNTFNPQQIYVRISNGTICSSITSFTLNVSQIAQATPPPPLEMCDTNADGIVTFDLTLSEIEILDVRQNDIVISYYTSLENLDSQINPIANPEAFTNTSNPQTVYVRLSSTFSACYLAIPVELIVNFPPAINPMSTINACQNDANYFNLLEVNDLIVDDVGNSVITYHATASDAMGDQRPISTDYTYLSNETLIFIRVENALTGCFITSSFNLRVLPLPNANTPNNLEDCDDDFDALLEFELTAQNAAILGGQNPANFYVSYHNSLMDAESGNNILPNSYVTFDSEIIYVRVENKTTGCFRTTQFSIIIHPKPLVDIPDQVICIDNLPLLVSANTNNSLDTYLWSTNQTTPEIEITFIGTYSVTVTTEFGCNTTQVFEVTESESANIEIVETVDFSDPNNITITINGIGNYLYQLDDQQPQESNIFENVAIGYHTITVIDLNGCMEVSEEVLVLDFPKFMTPNDDGYFDTWHIIGVQTLPGTVIYIYDRYGKQIHYLTSSSQGWDGTYNGERMPATDYWFVADVKGGSYEFQAKGHFALRR